MKRFLVVMLFWNVLAFGQNEDPKLFSLDANWFYGSIIEHNKDISHLITGHPTGFILSYSRRTFGFKDWEARYNYPEWGFSFVHQDLKNEFLGNNYALYGHFSFFFLKRKLMFRVGQGVAYASNPFDLEDNFRNNAFGTRFLSSTYVMLNFQQPNIVDRIGLQGGLSLIHYSNANIKAPNSSTNSITFNIGVNYRLDDEEAPDFIAKSNTRYSEPIKWNLVLRSGANEGDFVGLGTRPFLVVSSFLDKRVTHKSSFQVGAEVFLSEFLKDEIEYVALNFPEFNTTGEEDWKRVGGFIGHELRFDKVALVSQLGYYLYYPYDFEGRTYIRAGLKRYFGKRIFGAVTLKAHGAKAEAVEFGIGIRP